MLDAFFLWAGTKYDMALYLAGSKAAGVVCSYADIFVVAAFLRIMDIVRERPPSKVRFRVLAAFALLTPTLLLPQDGGTFFVVQFFVLVPPYLILIYTAATEAGHFVTHVKRTISDDWQTTVPPGEQNRPHRP
jgi:hypothetical protein